MPGRQARTIGGKASVARARRAACHQNSALKPAKAEMPAVPKPGDTW